MTNNIDRAAEVIYQARIDAPPTLATEDFIACRLADAGLLAPDLPAPDRDGRWWAGADGVEVRDGWIEHAWGLVGRTLAPDVARNLALALLAAADHAEEVGRADA